MSLFNLLHQSVVLKFTESAKPQFDPAAGYVFRLVGVDGMGYLQLQDLQPGPNDEHEVLSEPYWINKDLVREIHEYASALGKDTLKYTGVIAKPSAAKSAAPVHNQAPKPPKKPKAKSAVL